MTDETERRLRESLREANLPTAPESLREAVWSIAEAPQPRPGHRAWLRAIPAIAALVAVAVIVGVASGGFGRFGIAVSSATPSATVSAEPSSAPGETPVPVPTVPPSPAAPPTSVQVLDAAGLEARSAPSGPVSRPRTTWS